ncbi:uncharacterized protein EI90DRAFT_3010733 [Cantharellus anzutake]|uniref:uncharacterized protein n=1 Tax=Cantharellus anzutake TaxID=1750568 RepID=UPI001904B8E5|nr:uncharacterized protein EI90DRAFT_3010733 [Cantharellus anzutake]KAF8343866.1 hypothetical protein EI90DRAFT_3010733 [Cantharellus anzutake]
MRILSSRRSITSTSTAEPESLRKRVSGTNSSDNETRSHQDHKQYAMQLKALTSQVAALASRVTVQAREIERLESLIHKIDDETVQINNACGNAFQNVGDRLGNAERLLEQVATERKAPPLVKGRNNELSGIIRSCFKQAMGVVGDEYPEPDLDGAFIIQEETGLGDIVSYIQPNWEMSFRQNFSWVPLLKKLILRDGPLHGQGMKMADLAKIPHREIDEKIRNLFNNTKAKLREKQLPEEIRVLHARRACHRTHALAQKANERLSARHLVPELENSEYDFMFSTYHQSSDDWNTMQKNDLKFSKWMACGHSFITSGTIWFLMCVWHVWAKQ